MGAHASTKYVTINAVTAADDIFEPGKPVACGLCKSALTTLDPEHVGRRSCARCRVHWLYGPAVRVDAKTLPPIVQAHIRRGVLLGPGLAQPLAQQPSYINLDLDWVSRRRCAVCDSKLTPAVTICCGTIQHPAMPWMLCKRCQISWSW